MKWVTEWIAWIQSGESLMGLPLAAAGVVLMVLGWRVWKISLAVTFGLVGYGVCNALVKAGDDQLFYAIGSGVMLMVLSGVFADYAVAAAGGLIGATVFRGVLGGFGLHGSALWVGLGLAFVGFTALSCINRRKVATVITSFQGAVLLVAGMAALVSKQPELAAFFRGSADGSKIFLPFIVLVPTVVGSFLQAADIRKTEAGT